MRKKYYLLLFIFILTLSIFECISTDSNDEDTIEASHNIEIVEPADSNNEDTSEASYNIEIIEYPNSLINSNNIAIFTISLDISETSDLFRVECLPIIGSWSGFGSNSRINLPYNAQVIRVGAALDTVGTVNTWQVMIKENSEDFNSPVLYL